jgi:hypothetical protein
LFADCLTPQTEGNAIILVVGEGEPIPKQQESVTSPPVAIEHLLVLPCIPGSSHNELCILSLIPPPKVHILFKLPIYPRLRLNKARLLPTIDCLPQTLKILFALVELPHMMIVFDLGKDFVIIVFFI